MRNVSLLVICLSLFAVAARADDGIPAETLAAIKAATVYIKVEAQGLSGSGSGFVIKTDGDSAYIVTNHHVIEPKVLELILVPGRRSIVPRAFPNNPRRPGMPGMPLPHRRVPSLPRVPHATGHSYIYTYTPRLLVRSFKNVAATIVFRSGLPDEESVKGEVLSADPEQDLAVIKVSGVKSLPKPIDIVHEPKLSETMPIYTFGFPFGKDLATSKGGPAVTVGKGSVSSLRLDDDGKLALVQIDGALNPGNSGGPVVDAQGRLVGVAVATIRDSSGIGLAIPCQELTRTLAGRTGKVYLHATQEADGRATMHVEVGLIDPLNKIKSAELHYLLDNSLKDKPKPADPLAALTGCRKLPLKIENQVATADFPLEKGGTEVSILHQASYVNESGKPTVAKSLAETIHIRPAKAAIAEIGTGSNSGTPVNQSPPYRSSEHPRHLVATQIVGGAADPQFRDQAPNWGLLIGFDVGLRAWKGSDVVCAIRPVYSGEHGEERLGSLHGGDISRVVQIRAKQGYAAGAIDAKATQVLDGFSVTFMRINKDRLDPKDTYESDWAGAKGNIPPTRLGGDGAQIAGIVGKENSRDCTGLGLLQSVAGPAEPATTPPPRVAAQNNGNSAILHHHRHGSTNRLTGSAVEADHTISFQPGPALPPPGIAALEGDRVTRKLPEPADDVVAGGGGRYLLFHLPKLRKLAVFDVEQAKITHYVPLTSDDILYAAGGEKLIVVNRDQDVVQRYDLATLKKELTVSMPDGGQGASLALGYSSAGPALLMTENGPRFLDLKKLSLADPGLDGRDETRWRGSLQVRASADGSTFAVCGGGSSRIRLVSLEGATVNWRIANNNISNYNAGAFVQPSCDGNLLFTRTGIYSADLTPVSSDEFRGVACFPCYHPAYFLGFNGQSRISSPIYNRQNRISTAGRDGKTKLSLYSTSDKRLLLSFTEFDELNDPQEPSLNGRDRLSMDKRIHFFPTANLLVVLSAARDQLVLRRLDVTAALEKAGMDYLYVASLPPATAAPGSKLEYTIAVKSRRGGVHCTLDSGPDGMTLSDDGKLQWNVPASEPAGRQGIIITIKDASGQEVLHSFNLTIH